MQPADPDIGMRQIYFLSYLPGQVTPVLGYVQQALEQQRENFTDEQFAIAESLVERQLKSEVLEAAILQRLADQPHREYLDESIAWLNLPTVRKFMALQATAWSPRGQQEMRAHIEQELANPPSEQRLELIERYDQATHSSSVMAETMLLAAYGVAVIHDSLKPPDERLGASGLQDAIGPQRAVLKPIFKETSNLAHRFAFSQASDDEIESMVLFAESDAGQWFFSTISSNYLNALLEATANLGDLFRAAYPESPTS